MKDLNLDTSKIKGLIFDLDGTLADTMPLHLEAWNEVGEQYGLSLSQKDHFRYAGMPTRKIVRTLSEQRGLTIDPEEYTKLKEKCFIEDKLPKVQTIPAVAEFLYQLHTHMPMAIGTGSTRHLAEKIIKLLNVGPYVTTLVGADDVKKHKPAPDTFLACAKGIGIAPENCLVFEDADLGMKAAKAGGMQAINILDTNDKMMAELLNRIKGNRS